MEVLYLLIPLAVLLAGVIVWAFFWSVKSGQFDDLEGPAHRILMDDKPHDSPDKSAAQEKWCRDAPSTEPRTQGADCGAEGRQTTVQGRTASGAEGRKSSDDD